MTKESGLLVAISITLAALSVVATGPSSPWPHAADLPPSSDSAQPERLDAPVPRAQTTQRLVAHTNAVTAAQGAYADGRFDDALALFTRAIVDAPDDAELHNRLGLVLMKLERPQEAIRHLDTALAIDSTQWAYHADLARALGELDDWDRAVRAYQAAARLAPSEASVHYELGRALHERGNDRQAVTAYRTALSLDASDAAPHLALGISYEALRRWDEALQSYRHYLELAPDGPRSEALRWHVQAIAKSRQVAHVG